jgi:hypothetical protein
MLLMIVLIISTAIVFVNSLQTPIRPTSPRLARKSTPRGAGGVVFAPNYGSKKQLAWLFQLSAAADDEEGPKKKKKKEAAKSKTKGTRKAIKKTSTSDDDEITASATGTKVTRNSSATKTETAKKTEDGVVAAAVEEDTDEEEDGGVVEVVATTTSSSDSNNEPGKVQIQMKPVDDNIYGGVWYGPKPRDPDILDFDLTGGRPGAIIESEEELEFKQEIFDDMASRKYPKWVKDYGFLEEDENVQYDTDDPDAVDAATLGQYDITDLRTKFEWEWDPKTDRDPNLLENQKYDEVNRIIKYLPETEKDEDGIEVGYDPLYGPSNPIDERAILGIRESYVVDEATRDEEMLTPQFHPGDPEISYNEDIIKYRQSLDIIETYQDEFLPENMPVPRHSAKWYGYPELLKYPAKNYTNNRYTKVEDLTNFDEMTPFRARQRAVELARATNAEWMPDGVSQAWHTEQRRPYEEVGTIVGTLRKGECDPDLVEAIQPALKVLGSCADLLSIENDGTVFRFHYHGLIKNRYGMSCWTETLIRDCGVEVTGVIFETGFRARDPAYDGGDPYYGWE